MDHSTDVNLSEFMLVNSVYQVRSYSPCSFSVTLTDGRCASGRTVGEALERANNPAAINTRKAV